jgi:predicted MFS family arabinose efflux permease
MLSLCTQYWQVMLAQGLVVGFGTACLFTLSAIILPQYFLKKRALANGIAASGSSMGKLRLLSYHSIANILILGGVIYPIAVYKLLTQVGFEWTARIVGFIALGTCAISIALLRQRVKTPRKRILFDPKALLELPFFFFTVSFIFGLMGLYVPSFFIQSFAIEKGIITGELSAYVLPILNAAGVFGRVVPNFFADRTGPLNMLTPCLAGAGLLCLAWIAVANEGGLIVIALLFGFFSGAILSLPIIGIVSLSPSLAVIGTRLGTCSAIASLGLLVGTPVSGAILGTNGNYVGLQAFAGVVLLVAAVCCGVARVLKAGPRIMVKA